MTKVLVEPEVTYSPSEVAVTMTGDDPGPVVPNGGEATITCTAPLYDVGHPGSA